MCTLAVPMSPPLSPPPFPCPAPASTVPLRKVASWACFNVDVKDGTHHIDNSNIDKNIIMHGCNGCPQEIADEDDNVATPPSPSGTNGRKTSLQPPKTVFLKKCHRALKRIGSSGSLSSLGSVSSGSGGGNGAFISKSQRKQLSVGTATSSLWTEELDGLPHGQESTLPLDAMSVAHTLSSDVQSACALRPEVPDKASKEHVRTNEPKVRFEPEVLRVEMPQYKNDEQLKADLWFTNDEMLKMKVKALLKKK